MLNERFKYARKNKRLSQQDVADGVGVAQNAVAKIESGKTKHPRNIEGYADFLGVTSQWLLFGSNPNPTNAVQDESPSHIQHSKFVKIPILEASLAAGAGSYATDDVITEYMEIGRNRLEKYQVSENSVTIVPIRGDSMEPTLMSGDLLLINTAAHKPISGKIFAFDFDGDLRIKRFNKRLDGSWLISSDNDDKNLYRDETVSAHNINQLRVIGQAVTIVERNLL